MAGSFSGPVYAARPVGILDLGWVKLKVGIEYQKMVSISTATDRHDADVERRRRRRPVRLRAPHRVRRQRRAGHRAGRRPHGNLASRKASITRTSIGAFANVSNGDPRHPLIFGVGSMMTWTEDQNGIEPNPIDSYWLYQGFIAAQYVALRRVLHQAGRRLLARSLCPGRQRSPRRVRQRDVQRPAAVLVLLLREKTDAQSNACSSVW